MNSKNNKIIGSIVVFNPKKDVLFKTIKTFLEAYENAEVYVWDNSLTANTVRSDLRAHFPQRVTFATSGENLGYGTGNNHVFELVKIQAFDYFCILNPDLEIPRETISYLITFMENHPQYGLATGSIQDPNGQIQEVHKLLPTFYDYVLLLTKRLLKKNVDITNSDYYFSMPSHQFSLPIISGCFMLFRKSHFEELKGFDESFFLYFEDYDLSLRSYLSKKSIILPEVKIIHHWARDSHKSLKLFMVQLVSGIRFYRKWGFTSSFPKKINSQATIALEKRSP